MLTNTNRKNLDTVAENKLLPSVKEFFQMLSTFILTVFAWIFFRSENIGHAFEYIKEIFSTSLFNSIDINFKIVELIIFPLILFFLIVEWIGRDKTHALNSILLKNNQIIRWPFYFILIFSIFLMGTKEQEFIYFQF